ncbi:SDR family NAD(P)-dependent oxidoreductase [Parafrankia sp. BMG5.11]|uniref:SDR family NAD(P)-dependent oxidoreductase n=1 Tax=Parafrankia sp. BMG5.11 TaxID=222540 RepID=UPI00103F4259|nr:SDR family NAD(P)-dependent oxidoreductase [Parafrankia sp. BMG5.11]TCJ37009.1 SDR family NAD(P)-dependent oxidoreductase [Parafrankia sp. BMG5.11]
MSLEEEKFAGGVAVITGAGSGIGAGFARRAGAIGMHVIVADIDDAAAQAVARQIRDVSGKAEAFQLDVSQPAELDRLAHDVFDRHGSVRLLVNNAGIETLGFAWEIPVERWEKTLDVNLHGVVHGVRAFVPKMLESGAECWIGNLASVGSFGMMPTQSAYMVTKHAVQSFSECLFLEMQLKQAPIHVCSIIPGMIRTNIFNAENSAGEPDSAERFRRSMHDMMANYGMDLEEGCAVMMRGLAEGKFWVSSQPEMTADIIAGRAAFLQGQSDPAMSDQTRALVE